MNQLACAKEGQLRASSADIDQEAFGDAQRIYHAEEAERRFFDAGQQLDRKPDFGFDPMQNMIAVRSVSNGGRGYRADMRDAVMRADAHEMPERVDQLRQRVFLERAAVIYFTAEPCGSFAGVDYAMSAVIGSFVYDEPDGVGAYVNNADALSSHVLPPFGDPEDAGSSLVILP